MTEIRELLEGMVRRYDPEVTGEWDKIIQYNIGTDNGKYYVRMDGKKSTVCEGESDTWDLKIITDTETWLAIASEELEGPVALLEGRLKYKGDIEILMNLKKIFGKRNVNDIWINANALAVKRMLQDIESYSLEELNNLQHSKFMKLVRYAAEHCPFYKKLYREIDLNNFCKEDLPSITKTQVMENFNEIVTDPRLRLEEIRDFLKKLNKYKILYKGEFIVGATSGTMGTPGVFVYNTEAWRTVVLSNTRGMQIESLRGPDDLSDEPRKFAMITSPNIDSLSAITIAHIPPWLVTTKILSTLEKKSTLVKQLNAYQPDVLCGHASILRDLAYEQMEGRLKINVSRIETFAEFLPQYMRETLEKGFNGKVSMRYQASEVMNIGWECDNHDGLHLNSDLVLLECLDENNNLVPNGERGSKILVTNLYNYTQPLIRYEIDDLVTMRKNACNCGIAFPLIERVEGRSDGVLWFRNKKREIVPIYPLDIETIIAEIKGIKSFQVKQESEDKIEIKVLIQEHEKAAPYELENRFSQQLLKSKGLSDTVEVIITRVDEIPRDMITGKYRQIINKWGKPNE